MSEFFIKRKDLKDSEQNINDWKRYTVLIPDVSVGNVPQLATDLLISTLIDRKECQLIGYIYSSALMPFSGPDPYRYDGQLVATSAQVFECRLRELVVIQLRTPPFKELRKEFYDSFTKWLSSHRFKRVVILTSSFIQHLAPTLTSGDCYPLRYLLNETLNKDENQIKESLKLESVERVDKFSLEPSPQGIIHLPGSGFAKALLKRLDNYKIPGMALVLYCSEGDNRPHAFVFADCLNQWLNLIDSKIYDKNKSWIVPFSWRLLFGEDAPKTLY